MTKPVKYDVFISYRRDAFESANLIAEKLRSAGYTVFFDVEMLRSGKFNGQLFVEIEHCKDFIVVLSKNALDRCVSPDDWVRLEVCHAMKFEKNIIPVMLTGFAWPKPMPEGMEELSNYQAIASSSHDYFDLSMKRLMGYLKSKPHKKQRAFLLKIAALMVILLVCSFVAYYAFRLTAIPLCKEVATTLSQGMGVMNLLGTDNSNLQQEWERFCEGYEGTQDTVKLRILKDDMYQAINHYRNEVNKLYLGQGKPYFEINEYRTFLLGLYDTNVAELDAFCQTYQAMFDDLNHQFDFIQDKLDRNDFSKLSLMMVDLNFRGFQHSLNSFYYGYMEFISLLPQDALELHRQIVTEWNCLPNGIGLNLSKEEYEQFQKKEMNEFENLIKETEIEIVKQESDLNELEEKLERIEEKISSTPDQVHVLQ